VVRDATTGAGLSTALPAAPLKPETAARWITREAWRRPLLVPPITARALLFIRQPFHPISQSSWSSFRETWRLTTFYPLAYDPA